MKNYNPKRVEFSGKNKNDAFELQKILLRNADFRVGTRRKTVFIKL